MCFHFSQPSPHLSWPPPRSQRKVLTVRRHPSDLSSAAPGRLARTTWDSAHFPRSDYPGLLGRNRPLPLRPSPPPLPPLSTLILSVDTAGALHSSRISSLAAQISADDVCCAHMCDHTSVESPSVPAGSGKAEFYESKRLIKELGCVGLPEWFSVLASHH